VSLVAINYEVMGCYFTIMVILASFIFIFGIPRLFTACEKIYPRRWHHLHNPSHLVPEGQPSGGMPLAGRGRRLRVGLRPTPGRLRGTALGVLRPLCEELAGRHGGTASAGPGRDKAGSGPKTA